MTKAWPVIGDRAAARLVDVNGADAFVVNDNSSFSRRGLHRIGAL